jgi:hypothetical protein
VLDVLRLLPLIVVIWVAVDASKRDWSGHRFADRTWKWVLGSFMFTLIVFPIYLVHRRRVPMRG